jgi:hypothetical protein
MPACRPHCASSRRSRHTVESTQARPDPTARRLPVKAALPASLPRSLLPLGPAALDGSPPPLRWPGHEPGGPSLLVSRSVPVRSVIWWSPCAPRSRRGRRLARAPLCWPNGVPSTAPLGRCRPGHTTSALPVKVAPRRSVGTARRRAPCDGAPHGGGVAGSAPSGAGRAAAGAAQVGHVLRHGR